MPHVIKSNQRSRSLRVNTILAHEKMALKHVTAVFHYGKRTVQFVSY